MPYTAKMKELEQKMDKTLENLLKSFTLIRTGRASPILIEDLRVMYYGQQVPLKSCTSITVPEARQLLIKPFEASQIKDIEKALLASDLGVTPQSDGKVIRLTFPPLNEERRKKLVADVSGKGEEAKVITRNLRRDAVKALETEAKKTDSGLSKDTVETFKNKFQDLQKKFEERIDAEVKKKSTEIMEI